MAPVNQLSRWCVGVGFRRSCAGLYVAAMLLVSGCQTAVQTQSISVPRSPHERLVGGLRAKNVILVIGDGMGFNHVDALSLYESGKTEMQPFEWFPLSCAMSTYMSGQEYDPGHAWQDFRYVSDGRTLQSDAGSPGSGKPVAPYTMYTDSAAAATAMATGTKTYRGAIGVGLDRMPVETLVETAHRLEKATGVVTSVQFSHATPASFAAHAAGRNEYAEIAQQMLYRSPLDVVMGCGHPLYDDSGAERALERKATACVGGPTAWEDMSDGRLDGLATAGVGDHREVDVNGDGTSDKPLFGPWHVVQDAESFRALADGDVPDDDRVVGLARAASTLQQARAYVTDDGVEVEPGDATPFQCRANRVVPSLTTMARGALNTLRSRDTDGKGFFLMVEGGAIDWASHSNDTTRMVEEMVSFREMVNAVCDWVESESSWRETLLIVTADHETGYLLGPGSGVVDGKPVWRPLKRNGPGLLPGVEWFSKSHTNSLVPFCAKGVGAAVFERLATRRDPVRGAYLDNTDIAPVIRALWGDHRQAEPGVIAGM